MPSQFPNSLDDFSNPTAADSLNTAHVIHSDQHTNANDAIEAIQSWVGTSGTSAQASHEYRIKQLENTPPGAPALGVAGWDEGVPLGTGTVLNVVGEDVSLTRSGTVLQLTHTNPAIVFPQEVIGLYGQDEGVGLGTGTVLNVTGDNIVASLSGTVLNLHHTNPTFPQSQIGVFVQDEGVPLGTGTTLNFVGGGVLASISGTVVRVLVTGSGVTDHGALTGLADDDHTQYLLASDAVSRADFVFRWQDLTDGGGTSLHQHGVDASEVSYTPADNNDWSGGVDPGQVDDALDQLAGRATDLETGWTPVSATWTRTGDHTFTVSGDVTATYRKGTKVKYNDGATDYGVIGSSSHAAGTTTVNLIPNTSYVMAAGTITDTYLSYIANPEGYPGTFNFTSTPSSSAGTLTAVTQNVGYFVPTGKNDIRVVTVHTITNVGTGSGVFRATGPINAAGYSSGAGRENAVTGNQLNTVIDASSNLINMRRYDNASLVVVNYQLAQSTVYTY